MARKTLIHKHTNLTTTSGGVLSPKLPTAGTLLKGEIAVNYKNGYETLSIENDAGEVIPFASLEQTMAYTDASIVNADWNATSGKAQILNKPDIPDEKLSSSYQTSTLENDNLLLAGGDTYETAFSKIEKAILDNEETIAASLNDLNTRKVEIDDVPTKTSQLTNDSGYITSFTETDPTVPSHVKAITTTDISNWNNKLSSAPVTSVNGQTGAVTIGIPENQLSNNYSPSTLINEDLALESGDTYEEAFGKLEKTINDNEQITSAALTELDSRIPTKTSDLNNDSNFTTLSEVTLTIVNSAPGTLDTLNELAAALGDDPNFATTIATQIGNKADKSSMTAGTYKSVTVNNQGIVTGGTNPTTLAGYGITDAINTSSTAQTKAGNLTAAKFITNNGTSSQVVMGDGSLVASKQLPQYESYLEWGGKNFSASYGPIDAAMVSELGAPRTMFAKAAGIVVEYSTDGGNTWVDYGATDTQKVALFSSNQSFYTGKNSTAGGGSPNNMLRVSLRTGAASIYTSLNKFVIYVGTNGSTGCYCTIRCRTQQNYEDNVDTWVTIANQVSISGWSGYNVINISPTTTYGNTKSSQYGEWQFIFGCTNFSGNYTGLCINKIIGFGGVGWTTPSNMAKTGHLYSFDANQNATFPAQIQATSFKKTGGTSSQFLKADGSVDSNTYLTSHQLLKTINNESLIGSGNITIQGGSGGDVNVIETVKVNGTALTPDANKAVNITVPAAVTESTVSGWGFTKNTGTYSKPSGGIPKSDLADAVQTSLGKADTALQSFTESDPTVPSHVKEITTTDISNWNNKLSSAPVTSVNGQTGAVSLTIPSAVTESTVSGWGFTKNSGTVTGVKMNGTTKNPTSGVVDLGTVLTSFTETDPTVPSHVKGITTTDISNWNGKQAAIADLSDIRSGAALGATALQSYTETDPTVPAWAKATNKPTYTAAEVGALPDTYTPPVTSVNGQTGAVSLTIPSAPGTLNTTATTAQSTSSSEALSGNITLHKVAKTGTYNDLIGKPTIPAAVTESTVSGWGFTKNEGTITGITMNGSSKGTSGVVNLGTVLTEHQTLKTINNESIVGTGNLTISSLPTVTASDNGKVLMVVNGAWAAVTPVTVYTGTSTPNNSLGNNGDLYVLTS